MIKFALSDKRKKFIGDVGLNIIANIIMTGTLQIAVYPFLGYIFNSVEYGSILLLMGIVNMFGSVYGTALNNTRLVKNNDYKNEALSGDFNLLFLFFLAADFICTIVVSKLFENTLSNLDALIIGLLGVLVAARTYYSVEYRLKLNYKHILFMHIIYAAGSLLGLILVNYTHFWEWSFFIGEAAALIYLLFTTQIYKERYRFTKLLFPSLQMILLLCCTFLLSNSITYLDRLFLYPMFGGRDVSVYTVASFFGKSLGLIMTPITSVLLSYYARRESMAIDTFKKQIVIVLICCGAFFLLSISGLSVWFTGLLYPKLIEQSVEYIPLANLAAIIAVGSNILAIALIKFCHTGWQILIYGVHVIIYLILSVVFSEAWGLIGFCWATLLSNVIKLAIISRIGVKKLVTE